MNLTLPQITEVIAYDPPPPPGTVYTAWSPRTGSQSPDINPPTDEFVVLSWMAHEADEAETQPVIDLAAVMPQPEPEVRKPLFGRGTHRPPPRVELSPGSWMLAGAGGLLLAEVFAGLLGVLAAIR
jgi:hypothetical protein